LQLESSTHCPVALPARSALPGGGLGAEEDRYGTDDRRKDDVHQ